MTNEQLNCIKKLYHAGNVHLNNCEEFINELSSSNHEMVYRNAVDLIYMLKDFLSFEKQTLIDIVFAEDQKK